MQNNFNKLGSDMIEFLGTSYDTGKVNLHSYIYNCII